MLAKFGEITGDALVTTSRSVHCNTAGFTTLPWLDNKARFHRFPNMQQFLQVLVVRPHFD
jgi:hypothetical protein